MFLKYINKEFAPTRKNDLIPTLSSVEVCIKEYREIKKDIFTYSKQNLVLVQDPKQYPFHSSSILLFMTSPTLVVSIIYEVAALVSTRLRLPVIAIILDPGLCFSRLYRFLYHSYKMQSIGVDLSALGGHLKDVIAHFSAYFSANIVLVEYCPSFVENEHMSLTPAHQITTTLSLLHLQPALFYFCPYPVVLKSCQFNLNKLLDLNLDWISEHSEHVHHCFPANIDVMKAIKRAPSFNTNHPQYLWTPRLISTYIHVYDETIKESIILTKRVSHLSEGLKLWFTSNNTHMIRELVYSDDAWEVIMGAFLSTIVNTGLSLINHYLQSSSNLRLSPELNKKCRNFTEENFVDFDLQLKKLSALFEGIASRLTKFDELPASVYAETLTGACTELTQNIFTGPGCNEMLQIDITTYMGYIPLNTSLAFTSKLKSTPSRTQNGVFSTDSGMIFASLYSFALYDTYKSITKEDDFELTPQYLLWVFYNAHIRRRYFEMLQFLDLTKCPIVSQVGLRPFVKRNLILLQILFLSSLISLKTLDHYFLFIFITSFTYSRPEPALTRPMPLVSRQYLAYEYTIRDILLIISPIYRKIFYLYAIRYIECKIAANYWNKKAAARDEFQLPINWLPDTHNVNNQTHRGLE